MIRPVTVSGKRRYRVVSESGKNLGTSPSSGKAGRAWAHRRLAQVEYFKKHRK